MLSYFIMIAFCLYLAGYGYIALFKKEWLVQIRAFSARIEGKSDIKNEDLYDTGAGSARNFLAVISLVLGIIGFIMTIAMMVIYLQAQSGIVSV